MRSGQRRNSEEVHVIREGVQMSALYLPGYAYTRVAGVVCVALVLMLASSLLTYSAGSGFPVSCSSCVCPRSHAASPCFAPAWFYCCSVLSNTGAHPRCLSLHMMLSSSIATGVTHESSTRTISPLRHHTIGPSPLVDSQWEGRSKKGTLKPLARLPHARSKRGQRGHLDRGGERGRKRRWDREGRGGDAGSQGAIVERRSGNGYNAVKKFWFVREKDGRVSPFLSFSSSPRSRSATPHPPARAPSRAVALSLLPAAVVCHAPPISTRAWRTFESRARQPR